MFRCGIHRSAMGENIPCRDLLVSPDHALLIEGVLISRRRACERNVDLARIRCVRDVRLRSFSRRQHAGRRIRPLFGKRRLRNAFAKAPPEP